MIEFLQPGVNRLAAIHVELDRIAAKYERHHPHHERTGMTTERETIDRLQAENELLRRGIPPLTGRPGHGLVCMQCARFLRIKKNGISVEEGKPTGRLGVCTCRTCATCHTQTVCNACGQCVLHSDSEYNGHAKANCPGCPEGKELWDGYKLWRADLYVCPGCGFELASGFPQKPFREHFMADYAAVREREQPRVRVDDCQGAKP